MHQILTRRACSSQSRLLCPSTVFAAEAQRYAHRERILKLSKGFSDVRIVEGGYSALTEALKPDKVLELSQNEK